MIKQKQFSPNRSDQYNLIHGIFQIDTTLSVAQRVYFYFELFNRTFDLLLDDVSVTPFDVDSGCKGHLIRNGNFSFGKSMYWYLWDTAQMQMLNGSDFTSGYAMMSYARATSDAGISQNLYRDCLVAGDCLVADDRYAASVRYKLMTATSKLFACNRTSTNVTDSCLQVKFYTYKNGATTSTLFGDTVATLSEMAGRWLLVSTLYSQMQSKPIRI
jgi:hypothetical protein